ncbi:Hypothetical protein A7982_10423 [Minicystis rosea]|nr:Hypothetical protein A7982_10423 [Minicystis rosea]
MIGCGGKVVVDGTGGSPAMATSCDAACARLVATCGQEDQASCVAACEQNVAQSEANGCQDLNDALMSCIVTASDPVQCGPGMGVPASCQSLYEKWDACP